MFDLEVENIDSDFDKWGAKNSATVSIV